MESPEINESPIWSTRKRRFSRGRVQPRHLKTVVGPRIATAKHSADRGVCFFVDVQVLRIGDLCIRPAMAWDFT